MAKTASIQLRVEPELKDYLMAAAAAENRSITNYIETLLRSEMKKKEENNHE